METVCVVDGNIPEVICGSAQSASVLFQYGSYKIIIFIGLLRLRASIHGSHIKRINAPNFIPKYLHIGMYLRK
jgi:hypothetical protein